ncbi:MAG: glycosyltransferase family 39 protein [Clostridia bacterium]|nr:glycosyltransferase family 39 protein [Clostridia bacterium]
MKRKIMSIAALWLMLAALVFAYTDRDEYTWVFAGEDVSHVLLSSQQAQSREEAAQQAMALEKAEALARRESGEWGKEDLYNSAPKTRPAVDDALGLNLMWGDYEVTVSYASPADLTLETVSALRQPFIQDGHVGLGAGEKTLAFTFSLTDSAEQVAFACDLPEGAEVYEITVHKAGAGVFSRDLAAYALLAGCVMTVLLVLSWNQSPEGKLRRRDALVVILTALFASMPLLWKGIYSGHDLFFHLGRIEGIASGLRAGQFPVSIHASTLLGYGYGASQFYPEVFLYIPAILRNLGVSLAASVRVFEMLIHFAAAAICYFSARAVMNSRRIALGTTMLYTLCSYRLSNMYVRATLGESLAMIFFPLLIWALVEVITRDERKWPLLALAMTGIFLSHLLSTLFAAILCMIAAVLGIKHMLIKPSRILACMKAALVTVLFSAVFLVPFVDYLDAGINTSVALTAYDHMLRAGALFIGFPGAAENLPYEALDFSYTVGVVPGLAIVLGCAMLLVRLYMQGKEKDHTDRLMGLLLLLGGALFLLSTQVFPWEWACHLPRRYSALFQQIQYPWRLVGVGCAPLAFAAAWGYMKDEKYRTQSLCLIAALCMVFAGYSMQAFVQDVPLLEKEDFCDTRIEQYEYTYEGTEKSALVPGEITALDAPAYTISDYQKQGTNLSFVIDAPEGFSSLELPLLYYPGYQAEADGNPLRVVRGNNNLIRLYGVADTEDAHIRVWFDSPIAWKISAGVSIASWLLLAALILRGRRRA